MEQILKQAFPNALDAHIAEFAAPIADVMDCYEINTFLRQAHFLAQIGHESGELLYREEIASGRAYEWRRDLGNTQRGDGVRFKGRGLIQLTGRYNYQKYDEFRQANGKYIENPSLVADEPFTCVDVAGWYWDQRKLNRYADKDSVWSVTYRINGGYNGLRDRMRLLGLAKRALGMDKQDSDGRRIQTLLSNAGYKVSVDGVIGPQTKNAIIQFQRANGLVPDGIVGPVTLSHLKRNQT